MKGNKMPTWVLEVRYLIGPYKEDTIFYASHHTCVRVAYIIYLHVVIKKLIVSEQYTMLYLYWRVVIPVLEDKMFRVVVVLVAVVVVVVQHSVFVRAAVFVPVRFCFEPEHFYFVGIHSVTHCRTWCVK